MCVRYMKPYAEQGGASLEKIWEQLIQTIFIR